MFTLKTYEKLSVLCIWFVALLFLIGSFVRATGSGMGCPDWPKCFGEFVPPTDVSELPENYEEFYLKKRKTKVTRLVSTFNALGMSSIASKLQNSPQVSEKHEFNVLKAYIEYVNRLFGVILGILSILALISSFQFLKTDKKRFFLTLIGFILIVFNGWTGALLVHSNLLRGFISFHFFSALVALATFIVCRYYKTSFPSFVKQKQASPRILFALFSIILLQFAFGVSVRELLEEHSLYNSSVNDEGFISLLGMTFFMHRILSPIILFFLGGILYRLYKKGENKSNQSQLLQLVFFLILGQYLTGVINVFFSFPVLTKVFHVALSSLVFIFILKIIILTVNAQRKKI